MTRFSTTLIAAALTVAAGASFAQSATTPVTREQVRAELEAARRSGALNPFDSEAALQTRMTTQASREQVRNEVVTARRAGEVNPFDSEAALQAKAPSAPMSPVVATVRTGADRLAAQPTGSVTREQVRAELEAARRSGALNPFDTEASSGSTPPRFVPQAKSALAAN